MARDILSTSLRYFETPPRRLNKYKDQGIETIGDALGLQGTPAPVGKHWRKVYEQFYNKLKLKWYSLTFILVNNEKDKLNFFAMSEYN